MKFTIADTFTRKVRSQAKIHGGLLYKQIARVSFAALVFSFRLSMVALVGVVSITFFFYLIRYGALTEIDFLYLVGLYVFGYVMVTGLPVFMLSFMGGRFNFLGPRIRTVLALGLAALPINVYLWHMGVFDQLIPTAIASLVTIYLGEKIYAKTVQTLDSLNRGSSFI